MWGGVGASPEGRTLRGHQRGQPTLTEQLPWSSLVSFALGLFLRLEDAKLPAPRPKLTLWPHRPLVLMNAEPSPPRAGFAEAGSLAQGGCKSQKVKMSFFF